MWVLVLVVWISLVRNLIKGNHGALRARLGGGGSCLFCYPGQPARITVHAV